MITGIQTKMASVAIPTQRSTDHVNAPEKRDPGFDHAYSHQPRSGFAPDARGPDTTMLGRAVATAQGVVVKSNFDVFAKNHDVHAMTPYEVDALIDAMPQDGPDAANLFHLVTFGAEFQRHLARTLQEAGIAQISDADLEKRLNAPMDLVQITEDNIKYNRLNAGPTSTAERFLTWLRKWEGGA